MPKATKKKREKVEDFKKAKLKLGKGKKPASNGTDTSFKARSIALPSQKPLARALANQQAEEDGDEPAGEPTTSAGLTIDEVLIQIRHANAGVRREAVFHLKEVLVAGMNMGIKMGQRPGEVAKVVRAIGGLIADDDAAVRKALHDFLGWYLARLPKRALSPYLGLLQLQISSALSHIFPAIRLDACKLVELLLETHPAEIVANWPTPAVTSENNTSRIVPTQGDSTVFEGLRLSAGLGEEKGASTQAGFRMTPASKLIILRTIKMFIAQALRPTLERAKNVLEAGRGAATPLFGEFTATELSLLPPGQQRSLDAGDFALEWSAEFQPAKARGQDGVLSEAALEELAKAYLSLHSLLLSTFMESAPSVFGPSQSAPASDDIYLNLCSVCAELECIVAQVLLGHTEFHSLPEAGQLRSSFSEFLKRMTAWFPFNKESSAASDSSATLFGLSLSYVKLAAILAPKPPTVVLRTGKMAKDFGWRQRVRAIETSWKAAAQPQGKHSGAEEVAFNLASEWLEESLEPNTDVLAPPISLSAYEELLPVIWTLLLTARKSGAENGRVDEAFMTGLLSLGSASSKRRVGDGFVVRLIEQHEDRFSTLPFFVPVRSALRSQIQLWLSSVPRSLWEIGAKDDEATTGLLRFLLEIGRRGPLAYEAPYSLIDVTTFPALAAKLAPFFHLQHPAKGSVDGPWAKLAAAKTQKLALDVARVWRSFDDTGRLDDAVSNVVHAYPWAHSYWHRT
ncbi:rRNA processing protein [Vanrija albida]|uniref:Pre-rRNA-processing protein n=1 Tax=Vanrija albida TaxID=181172 RepID=A0ABR3QFJ3_9TREE